MVFYVLLHLGKYFATLFRKMPTDFLCFLLLSYLTFGVFKVGIAFKCLIEILEGFPHHRSDKERVRPALFLMACCCLFTIPSLSSLSMVLEMDFVEMPIRVDERICVTKVDPAAFE